MSDNDSNGGGSVGCGCVSIIIFILVMWALFFGLPINDKVLNIDIFPPKIELTPVEELKAEIIDKEKEEKPKEENFKPDGEF